ncbi:golgin subfamily A member 4 isoform X3 [Pseudophryne corroboree]|uniref:golgin subfamily A member 4 isoform X3 n=1 Tax=Pseudophryne corroboree TaxID=495146 RepID=UPI003081902C
MFKKLKQKITEEQSPVRGSLSPQQQGQPRASPTGNRSRTSSLTEQQDDSTATPDKELLAGMIAEPALLSEYTIFALDQTKRSKPQSGSVNMSRSADGVNGNDSTQKSEGQSFAQKIQLRVPSMESLFRSPVKETLFRSPSKESLVRSGSRDSLNRIELDSPGPVFDPPSDIESEAEESMSNLEGLNREQLFHRLRRMEKSLGNYRGKYSELVTTYRTVQRDKEKLQSILSQSQDKALRRIGELREELQMDQQAKKHLQEEFDASLEEKDQLISVLQTQVTLLKQRFAKGQTDSEMISSSEHETQSAGQEEDSDNRSTPDGSGDTTKTLDALQIRVKRQENLLQRCKEKIRSYKDQCSQLSSEKDALQNQLDERLQELEKIKELHTSEKTKLITQLRDAKNLVEQLEQDKGMVIAETKRQMHEAMMMKEEEVSQLRTRVKQLTTKCDQLQEQKEKSEKAAFEQLERAVGASQSSEEAQKKGQQQMEDQIKAIEQASEEERLNLQKELSRVKQEVVDIMKKTYDGRVLELEKLHAEALQNKEQDYKERLRKLEEEYQERLKADLIKGQEDHLNTMQEKEQQALLALEEMELQKKAIQSQTENQLQEMQQELEECRTRILELESFLAKTSQDSDSKSEEMATRIENETNKHNAEITEIIEKHKQVLELREQESEKNLKEKLESLKQEHEAAITAVKEKFQKECDLQIKEKEQIFQTHIVEMNEKTLEKLDVKQTELEALSSELGEAQKLRQEIEVKLLMCQNEMDKLKQDFVSKQDELEKQHREHVGAIEKEKEMMTEGVEKGLKEEINHFKLLLDGKEQELELEKQKLKEAVEKANEDSKSVSAKLDELRCSHEKTQEDAETYAAQLTTMQEKLTVLNDERDHLKNLVEEKESNLKILSVSLDSHKEQVQTLALKIQEQTILMTDQLNSLTLQSETKINEYKCQIDELARIVLEKEIETQDLKETHNQLILELNQTVSSKEKKIASLQEEYQAKAKSQDSKIEKMKQRIKEMQETSKKRYSEMESKLKIELEKKQLELNNKEKQFNEKMLEMAHASSAGINDAMSQLEQNHKEQMQSIKETHQREKEETIQTWEKKLNQHAEELKEKHEVELQEKDQEVAEFKQLFTNMSKEKEDADKQIIELREEKSKLDISFHELQDRLNQASAQVLTLTQSETNVKSQHDKVQNECMSLMNDKNILEEQLDKLKLTIVESKSRVDELLDKLQEAEAKCQSVETESATLAKEMAEKLLQKESWCNQLILDQENKMESFCKEVVLLLESMTSGLSNKYNDHINRLILRITYCEQGAYKLKENISKHVHKIHDLETQLEQIIKEYTSVNVSMTLATQLLQEKENVILSMKDELNVLTTEKEVLQKEEGNQQKVADEKELCITQLKKDLSENINTLMSLSATLKERDAEVNELKAKLENSVDLAEKEKTVSYLSTQHRESQQQLQNQIQDLMSKIDVLNKEKTSSVEEVDKLRNKLEEWRKKAELRFTQNHQTIKDLQEKIEMSNKQILEKDEQIQKSTENFETHRLNTEADWAKKNSKELELTTHIESQNSRIKQLEAVRDKLTAEKTSLMEEVERLIQQQSMEKKELVQQLHHIQSVSSEKDNNSAEAQQVQRLEKDIVSLKEEYNAKEIAWEQLKTELTDSKDKALKALEDRLTAENTKKMAELKKKAEQKIASVKKQLMSQMEEKEKCRQDLEIQLKKVKTQMQSEGQALQEGLNQEKEELEKKYSLLLEQHRNKESELSSIREELMLKVQSLKELEDAIEIIQNKFCESEQMLKDKELSIEKDREAEKLNIDQLSSKHMEALVSLKEQLAAKDSELKASNERMQQKSRMYEELQVLFDEIQSQENTLKLKLQEAEGNIEKYRKEVTKLQKDMRTLRKEHNQELDLLKKELLEEAEQKIKYEQEDTQLKHNSALKHLMREVNTQMAQKERELETAVQETIGKAQEVEAELMQSHHIETTQLHKKIAEKEDDLKRTVKKYEDILEAREEEMSTKVTELQEQLEKLQEELSRRQEEEAAQDGEESDHEELQTQLAMKSTQLNEAKLKEQELKEKMNILEDQLKNYSRGVFVTPLGTPYKDVNHRYTDVSVFGEPTEFEYLRKVMFEYMMGRETKTMAKVITTVLRFPADQAQKILEKEEARPVFTPPRSGIF